MDAEGARKAQLYGNVWLGLSTTGGMEMKYATSGLRTQDRAVRGTAPRMVRKQSGIAVSALALVFGFAVLGAIGLFALEVSRAALASEQLKVATDAAGLAYLLTYADKGNSTGASTNIKATARKVADEIFAENTILGSKLQKGSFIDFEVVDGSAKEPVTVKVNSSCTVTPLCQRILGLSPYKLKCKSQVAFPKLDIVLCVEIGDRMADWTPVKFARRYRKWQDNDPGKGLSNEWGYDVCPNGEMVFGKRGWEHPIGYPLPPQMLIANHDGGGYFPMLHFNPLLRETGDPRKWDLPATFGDAQVDPATGLRGGPIRPGSQDEKRQYTDLVVDVPNWPLEKLVDESRAAQQSKEGFTSAYEMEARQQLQPLNLCLDSLRGFVDTLHERYPGARIGLVTFAGQAASSAYSDPSTSEFKFQSVSTGYGDTAGGSVVGKGVGEVRTYTLPYSQLTDSADALKRKLSNDQDGEGVTVYPGSAINHGLDEALNLLDAQKDPTRRKVIVLLTRGLALGLREENKDDKSPWAYKLKRWMDFPLVDDFKISILGIHTWRQGSCVDPCNRARKQGIPIYTIGFYGPREEFGHYDAPHNWHFRDDPEVKLGSVDKDLGDQYKDGFGLAGSSGHGARYYRVAESDFAGGVKPSMLPGEYQAPEPAQRDNIRSRLDQVFQNIARNLVTL